MSRLAAFPFALAFRCLNRRFCEPYCVLNDAVGDLSRITLTFLIWLDHAASMAQSSEKWKSKTKVAHYPKLCLHLLFRRA